jgi:hypothetical protein
MTNKQPEALRLAEFFEDRGFYRSELKAAAELRRLHQVNAELVEELKNIANANPSKWDAEVRDQFQQWAQNRARATIAKATGE